MDNKSAFYYSEIVTEKSANAAGKMFQKTKKFHKIHQATVFYILPLFTKDVFEN